VRFEHKQGFFNVFNGAGNYDAAKILPGWANPFDIVNPGIAVKQYPCCGSTHSALDAALKLAREERPAADDIERIDVWTHTRRLEHTNRPDPKSDLDAKFSVQYCMARAFLDRTIAIEHFEHEAYRQPAIQKLLPHVHAAPYTTAQFPAENHYGAEVRVALRGGKVLSGKVSQPFGRTSENPLPASLLKEKFDNCALPRTAGRARGPALLRDTGLREPERGARADRDHRGRRKPRAGRRGLTGTTLQDRRVRI
jgi:2-methylcitrate dehydratase PrpD